MFGTDHYVYWRAIAAHDVSKVFVALKHEDRAKVLRLLNVEVGEIAQANSAASAVGANGCAIFGQ